MICPKCGSSDVEHYLYPANGYECHACGNEWFIGGRYKKLTKICAWCKKEFQTTDGWRKYCSEECESRAFEEAFKK